MTELKCPKCGETEAIYYYFAEKCGIKCGNTDCGFEIGDCESVEEAEFKWKSENDPEALRPCPFCGSEAKIMRGCGEDWVQCMNPKCECASSMHTMTSQAIQIWNRRVSE